MVVAGIGGVRPALVAVVVGFAAGVIVFSRPFGSLPIDRPVDLVALVAFVVVGGAVGILVDDLTRLAADLAASRARVVAAADEARRQIERDLHDGAQQRLVSLGLELRAAQTAVPPELPELDDELSRIVQGLAEAQDELREIARGIHPAILAEGGLGPALKTLARRSPVPVELDVRAERPAAGARRGRRVLRRRRDADERGQARQRLGRARRGEADGRARSASRSPTTAPAAPTRRAARASSGSRTASARSAARSRSRARPARGTSVHAVLPLDA